MKKSRLLALGLAALAIVAPGCRNDSEDFRKTGKFGHYDVTIAIDGEGRKISMRKSGTSAGINAIDVDNDERFDNIQLRRVPKGDPLEQYTNLRHLETVYDYVLEGDK
tara:strand:- start:237 stop:560 length:324 start_codon:yes stop_codon:yes gene_type:complete